MEELNFYNALLADKRESAPDEAEYLDEEINILIHKLKFIPQEQRPAVLIVEQRTGFQPLYNNQLADTIGIAGGILLQEKFDNPALLLVLQDNDALYGEIPALLEDELLSRTSAVVSNQIYIVQKGDLGIKMEDFLADVEICAEIIQPKYFIYGRQGNDWVKFDLA
ncbi:ABC transporter substrate-binding protein [Sphingobacterium oryzagri]|uniref:ABC transporter substrate-binding protein n=1 Tax=Sphingobacterium oryzagri TaxID=3025669 RepID=A0ABY7WGT5_9SPHI|nr:ABC transporter substrate-binding protein [Sphingobacterium sp. KACC 22765]WDF67737.1 ABC transporter substrate-binding protein [Sphingobacterium sp. KACC 22765]